jgi:hypothetical protein
LTGTLAALATARQIGTVVSLPTREKLLVDAPASLVELEKRLNEEAGERRLLAANVHDNPICTVNYDARIPRIVVVGSVTPRVCNCASSMRNCLNRSPNMAPKRSWAMTPGCPPSTPEIRNGS